MLLREAKYYLMSNNRLATEIEYLRLKLDTERDVKKVMKYLDALADVAKVLIRKNRDDDDFMLHARWMLYSLKAQADEAYEKSRN